MKWIAANKIILSILETYNIPIIILDASGSVEFNQEKACSFLNSLGS